MLVTTTTSAENVVTNVAALTQGQASLTAISETLGRKLYTASDFVDFTFTPNADEAVSSNTGGLIRVYFWIWDANNLGMPN